MFFSIHRKLRWSETLYCGPQYSGLQPIELVWARIKSSIARRYKKGTTLQDVRARLVTKFNRLNTDGDAEAISSIIQHFEGAIMKFLQEIREDEDRAD